MNLFVLFGRPLSMMDDVSATICDGEQAVCQKYKQEHN